jgi:hypothetical protein
MMMKDHTLLNLILQEHSTIGKPLLLEKVLKMLKIFYKKGTNKKWKFKMPFILLFLLLRKVFKDKWIVLILKLLLLGKIEDFIS